MVQRISMAGEDDLPGKGDGVEEIERGVALRTRPRTRKPSNYKVAETKVSQVIDFARENQHPLQCTLEKA
jgi:ATP-dependent Clp protease adaptor protein ClpS